MRIGSCSPAALKAGAEAAITQVPTPTMVALAPVAVQTFGVLEAKVTVLPVAAPVATSGMDVVVE